MYNEGPKWILIHQEFFCIHHGNTYNAKLYLEKA